MIVNLLILAVVVMLGSADIFHATVHGAKRPPPDWVDPHKMEPPVTP